MEKTKNIRNFLTVTHIEGADYIYVHLASERHIGFYINEKSLKDIVSFFSENIKPSILLVEEKRNG